MAARDEPLTPALALPHQGGGENARETPYAKWVRAEGLDVIDGSCIADLRALELKPWARHGGRGVYIHHAATPVSSDCYVCEIPPRGSLAPQRQRHEEIIFVLDGRGSTRVSNDAQAQMSFEWRAGALFAVPCHSLHQHFNGSGSESARLVAVTTAPAVMNAIHDPDALTGVHPDIAKQPGSALETPVAPGAPQTMLSDPAGVIDDAVNCPLLAAPDRGAGGDLCFRTATGTLSGHISQLPPATYCKARARGPGVYVIFLAGEGYSLAWPDGGAPVRHRWRAGALMAPPGGWWLQHFNCGRTPARYLTLLPDGVFIRDAQLVSKAWSNRGFRDERIDYAGEPPEIRESFAAALAENGLVSRMTEAYAAETA